jgi:hypothetical protein
VETDETSLRHYAAKCRELIAAMQSADARPTPEQMDLAKKMPGLAQQALTKWKQVAAEYATLGH